MTSAGRPGRRAGEDTGGGGANYAAAQDIRYGGNEREQTDEYWENVLKENRLPYKVLDGKFPQDRLNEALQILEKIIPREILHERKDQ